MMTSETGTQVANGAASDAPLTDRINAEPSILRGLSLTETWLAIGVSFAAWIPASLLIGIIINHLPAAVIFMGAGPIFTVWAASGWLAARKRNRPHYFYQHSCKKWLADKGLIRTHYITHSGRWDIGRSLPTVRTKRVRRDR